MERETKEIVTPIGKQKIILFSYLLGGEKKKFIHAESEKAQNLILESLIVSIDNSKEEIIQKVDNMHGKDYDYLFQEIATVIEESTWTKKKEK